MSWSAIGKGGFAARSLVLVSLLATAGFTRPQDPAADGAEFARVVAESAGQPGQRELERRAAELARLPQAVGLYLDLLARQARTGVSASPAVLLDAAQRQLLTRTAQLLPSTAVLAEVRARLESPTDDAWREPALDLLALHAGIAQLSLMAELVVDATRKPRAGLTESFTRALGQLLEREGVSARPLAWLMDEMPALEEPIVRAVGRTSDPEGLLWLTAYLGDRRLGQIALQEIGRLADSASGEAADVAAERIHPILLDEDESWRRGAIRALGRLEQPASIPWLLASLERERSPGVRRMIFAALHGIARAPLPEDPGAWRRWYSLEKTWYEGAGARITTKLSSADDFEVIAAVQELASHPLYRERIATKLAELLDHPSSAVRTQICLALGHLAAKSATDELARALEDAEEVVREAARRMLAASAGPSRGTTRGNSAR